MDSIPGDRETWEALLAAMAPPVTPTDAFARDPALRNAFASYNPLQLVLMLAGLQTDPAFQAHSVRFDWATRLALVCARGGRSIGRAQLERLLNARLKASHLPMLEDPIEDVMVEPVCTPQGEFLILTGTWEKAGHYTETVAGAFWMLPDGEPKREALEQIFALLALSDALVRRAGIARYTIGGGTPKADIRPPASKVLEALAERVLFTWHDLAEADIDVGLLAPFVLHPGRFDTLAEAEPGESPLEFHPLIVAEEGIVIAAPANISTAVRARLIDAAITGGMGDPFRRNILTAQSNLVDQGGLVRTRGRLAAFAKGFAREHVETMSLGRYVHVLHAIEDFGDFPKGVFAAARDGDPAYGAAIVDAIVAAHRHASSQPDFQHGASYIFLAGWGSGLALEMPLPPLPNWQIVALSPHDGFVLGGCADASLRDLSWMERQFRLVREQGFEFVDINGFLNRFQLWRNTELAFIPEHAADCVPPIRISFDTNLMLQARREAHLAWDRRVLPRPGGAMATMMRMSPKTLFDEYQPIYASYAAVQQGRVISAVLVDDRFPVWFELEPSASEDGIASEDSFETFKAMLEWAARVLPRELAPHLSADTPPLVIRLTVEWPKDGFEVRSRLSDAEIAAAIEVTLDPVRRLATINLASEWQVGLQRSDNQAEAALAAAVLNSLLTLLDAPVVEEGVARVRSILGSKDARWRHGLEVRRVVEMLKARGLVPRFQAIPSSTAALIRTGLGWMSRDRADGPVITGKTECRAFLDAQVYLLFSSLRAGVRQFRRGSLVQAALEALQAAAADDRHWDRSARALRAIHGESSDYRVSLERRHEINSVVRASSLLAEIAMVESPFEGGREVGPMDMSELQAHMLLCFETADLIPAIEGDRIAPKLTISPTGLVARDTGFEERTVQRSVRMVHEGLRDQAVRDYDKEILDEYPRDESTGAGTELSDELKTACQAEYGVALDTFVGLAQACGDVAVAQGEGVLSLRRSALIAALDGSLDGDIAGLIDRLTLPVRDGWDAPLSGAVPRDFDIAKLDRRFSLIGRPILALDDSEDPLLAVAPGAIERCILHNLQGAMGGALQGDFWTSRAMKKYVGERGRIEGNRFNDTVAEKIEELGLIAYSAAKPSWCFNHKNTSEVAELGDFDVLAITPDGRRAWVVEAKDLKLCRTIGESARRLSEYEGRMLPSGKPDKMLRHLRRVAYARRHAGDLARRLKLDEIPTVAGILVVRAPQPMEAFLPGDKADASVVMLSEIDRVPWNEGWAPSQ